MKYISLFSGVEAASLAWEPLGWEPVAYSEIDEFPSAILAARWPDVPNLGDITQVDWSAYRGAVDVVVGGSPCQSFSISGKREGLLDPRGMLMLEFVRAVTEIRPRFFLWENVVGCLSQDKGRAFGTLLREMDELGYSCAWRVLDSQFARVPVRDGDGRIDRWVGPVAQRRRRVFLVGCLGAGGGASAVLFEPEGVSGNHPSVGQKREALARAAHERAGQSGIGGSSNPIAFKYSAGAAARTMPTYDDGTVNTLTADWHSPAIAFNGTQDTANEEEFSPCLTHEGGCVAASGSAIAVDYKQTPKVSDDVCHTLTHEGDGGIHSAVATPLGGVSTERRAFSFAQNQRDEVRLVGGDGDMASSLSATRFGTHKNETLICEPVVMSDENTNAEIAWGG